MKRVFFQMNKDLQYTRIIDFISHLLFLVLFVFAFKYFEERLYADAGYYIFRVVNYERIWIEHNRFVLLFSQILPLIAVKLGFGLKSVLVIYSLGHVAFFYLIFLICRYVYGNTYAGILLALLQVIGLISGFFVPVFELYYASALLVLFATMLFYSTKKGVLVWQLIVSFFILTSHPTTYFLFFYLLFLHLLKFRKLFTLQNLFFLILFSGVIVFKSYMASEYETAKTQAFYHTLKTATYDFQYLKSLGVFLFTYYKDLMALLLLSVSLLLYMARYFKILAFILTFLGLLAISNVARYGFEHTRYQEQVYFPLVFLVVYTIIDELKTIKSHRIKPILGTFVLMLFIWKINVINSEGKRFNQRITVMKELIKKAQLMDGNKFVVKEAYLECQSTVESNWSYTIESLLISSSDKKLKDVTICTDTDYNFENNGEHIQPNQYLYRRWEIYSDETLNHQYFKISKGNYQWINEL